MKFSLTLAVAVFLSALVNAQSSSYVRSSTPTAIRPSTSSSSSASSAPSVSPSSAAPPSDSTRINVQVATGLYNPSNFTASNGTIVTFYFPSSPALHSVTQGYFDNPCVYLNDKGGAGFDSGLQSGKKFTIRITNDQKPIWIFCKAPGHCGLGMVGAINAPKIGDTFEAYLAAAKALGSKAPNVSDSGPVTGGVGAVATATPVATTS